MKSPEEEAKEIIEKFKDIEIGSEGSHSWGMTDWQLKQCAIIHVEGIIEVLKNLHPKYEEATYWHPVDYWQQVLTILKQ